MKKAIHPKWFPDAVVSCACSNRFTVGATKQELRVEICAKCHPFFTGEMKFVDTLGRVERFQKKQEKAKVSLKILQEKKKKKEVSEKEDRRPKSLREMLLGSS